MKREYRKLTKKEKNEFKYGLVAATQTFEEELDGEMTIIHFCGYTKPPTNADVIALTEELNTDPEFGLVGRIGKDVFILTATQEMVDFFVKQKGTRRNE